MYRLSGARSGGGLKVEGASSAADQAAFSRRGLEGGSKGWSRASVAGRGGLIRKRPLPHGRTVEPVPGAAGYQLATRGVRAKSGWGRAMARAVARWWLLECRSSHNP
jgi:hypothetical protein